MLDRAAFLRPIAHRGLHNAKRGIIENTAPAFEAAIAKGYGIECDLRPAAGGLPAVFHDETVNRLVDGKGPISALDAHGLKRARYKGADTHILTFAELLELIDGRVPLLVEIKSEWTPPDAAFLGKVARLALGYKGPLALMSFDPAVMAVMREKAPSVPRGIVSGRYSGPDWWEEELNPFRRFLLRHILVAEVVRSQFICYEAIALPNLGVAMLRAMHSLPVFAWDVTSLELYESKKAYIDAPIFDFFEL